PFDSSTVMTPSRPTLSWTSAMSSPISGSAAEMPAMCAISSLPLTSTACDLSSATTASTPFSRPRFRSIGFAPAAMFLRPSVTIAVLELDGDPLSGVGVTIARADGEDLAFLRLLLRGIGQHDPALRHFLALEGLDDDAGAEGLELELLCDCWHVGSSVRCAFF